MDIMKIYEFLPDLLELHCVTQNSPVTFKARSRSPLARYSFKIFTRSTCGIKMKAICEFLLEILILHCVTKNSPVTSKTRSRSPATGQIKDLY